MKKSLSSPDLPEYISTELTGERSTCALESSLSLAARARKENFSTPTHAEHRIRVQIFGWKVKTA